MKSKDKLYLIDSMERFIEELPQHKSNSCFDKMSLQFGARTLGYHVLTILDQLSCEHDWDTDIHNKARHCLICHKIEEINHEE